MGQSIYINADSSNLLSARVRGANDLRSQSFTQFVTGDSLELDLYLVNSSGLLNIQDYAEIRVGMGNLDSRPDSGDYLVGGTDTLAYNHTASDLKTVIDSQVATATVTMLADFVFKVQFDAVGAQTIPSLDFTDLQPGSTVSVTRLTTGDSVTREAWLWRIYRNPIAFTNVFTNIADNGVRGTLSLATSGIYDLLAQSEEVNTFFEVELTDTAGNVRTFLQAKVKLKGEVIGHNFSGSIPTSPTNSPEANAFLESFPNPEIVGDLDVEGNIRANQVIVNSTEESAGFVLESSVDGSHIKFNNGAVESNAYIQTRNGHVGVGRVLGHSTNNINIRQSDGFLGIKQKNPLAPLHIKKNGEAIRLEGSGDNLTSINFTQGTNKRGHIEYSNSNDTLEIKTTNPTGEQSKIKFSVASGVGQEATEAMRIQNTESGKQVVIGNPSSVLTSAELYVNGEIQTPDSIRANSVISEGQCDADSFKLRGLNTAPSSSTASGNVGEIRFTNSHIYLCMGVNRWRRVSLQDF